MPRGHAAKREPKKAKKKEIKQPNLSSAVFASGEVEVIKKRRKPKEEEDEE